MIAKDGDTVLVHYTGRLDSGEEFDSSRCSEPLEFTLGAGSVIPGFEKAVQGLEKGKSTTVRIDASDAYGEYSDDLLITVPLEEVPDDITPTVGDHLLLHTENGPVEVEIQEVTDKEMILNANHPLSGEALTFDIELMDILDGPSEAAACDDSDCEKCGCGCKE